MLLRERLRSPFARLLPAPAPLPSLQTAFSRRAALFGAVTVSGALAGSAMASAVPSLTANDARLNDLAVSLDRTLARTDHALAPRQDTATQDARLAEAEATLDLMAEIPADTLAGCRSKARAYLASGDFDVQSGYQLGTSLARDVLRLGGGSL